MTGTRIAAALLLLTASAGAYAQDPAARAPLPPGQSGFAAPVEVWLDRVSYRTGDRIQPYFRTEPGAYVTIIRITTAGDMRILYPRRPDEHEPYQIGQLQGDRVPYGTEGWFRVNEGVGSGFIFAIASYDKFDFSYFRSGNRWNTVRLASVFRYGDPFEIAAVFADRTLSLRSQYSIDYVRYDVTGAGHRSRYSSRYSYSTFDDYYFACIAAFGRSYGYYCSGYNPYYPIAPGVGRHPAAPVSPSSPRNTALKVRPLVPDPVLPAPVERQAVAGTVAQPDARETGARGRRELLTRRAEPRGEAPMRDAAARALPPSAPVGEPMRLPEAWRRPATIGTQAGSQVRPMPAQRTPVSPPAGAVRARPRSEQTRERPRVPREEAGGAAVQ